VKWEVARSALLNRRSTVCLFVFPVLLAQVLCLDGCLFGAVPVLTWPAAALRSLPPCGAEEEVRREMRSEGGGALRLPDIHKFDSNIITPVRGEG
jgi:hypothetical protein